MICHAGCRVRFSYRYPTLLSVSLITAITVCILGSPPDVSADLTNGLVLYYSFDTNSAPVPDDSGNGHTGTVYGATWTADGAGGGAYSLSNSWIMANGFSPVTGDSDFTVSFWTKLTGADWTSDVIDWGGGGVSNATIRIEVTSGSWVAPGGRILVQDSIGADEGLHYDSSSTVVSDGNWHFVAVSCTDHMVTIWIDGTGEKTFGPIASIGSDYPLTLGVRPDNTNTYRMHGGLLDEVRIYNRALATNEVMALYTGTRLARPALPWLNLLLQ